MLVLLVPSVPRARTILNAGNPDAKRLYDDLLSNYNKLVRPVVNTTDPLTVRIKLKLSQLIDVVSEEKTYTTSRVHVLGETYDDEGGKSRNTKMSLVTCEKCGLESSC